MNVISGELLGKRGTYLGGIGDTESKNETPCENVREPVMRLKGSERVSAQSFYEEGKSVPVCMLET